MAFEKGNQFGKAPRYTDPEVMRAKIDEYFEKCKGTLLVDHNGDPMVTRFGDPIYLDKVPPTLTGLALALGFKSREGMMRYKAKKQFTDLMIEAKTRIELYNEEQLYTRDGAKGAMFNLQRNFRGWQVETIDEPKGAAVNIINDIPNGQVTVNTETAVFDALHKSDEDAPEDVVENG